MNGDMFPEQRTEDPNRRYTTREFIDWICLKVGEEFFDVDVAADAESHHAPKWFSLLPYEGSAGVDGLVQSWLPPSDYEWEPWTIFCNPPFDDLESWVAKAWATAKEAEAADQIVVIAFVLPGNRHEQPFWQRLIEPYRDGRTRMYGYDLECHFPPGRQAYAKPGSNGVAVGSADFPSCLLVWRRA